MKRSAILLTLVAPLLLLSACGGGSSTSTPPVNNQTGNVFVAGEDAPVSSVVGFNITINSITLNTSSTSVSALSTPTNVDFARLVGLRTLLAFNSVAAGTYTSATFTFASSPAPTIDWVNLNTTPPSVQSLTGTLSQTTVTVQFPSGQPLVVGGNGLIGLHVDFDMRDSLAVDGNNQMTGVVNPVLSVQSVGASDDLGQITEFTGNVVSANTDANTFVMQGPYGAPKTIEVNGSTLFNGSNSLSTLVPNGIVSVIGALQFDGSILAAAVELITGDQAFISGRVLAVNPASGPVQTVTMWVGEELGTSAVIPVDTVYTINLSGVSEYDICFFDSILGQEYFNDSLLVAGQRIFIGGTVSGGVFTPDMVSLRRQGVIGQLVADSVTVTGDNSQGNFEMQNDALMSYSAGGPFYVFTGNPTYFVNVYGLSGLQAAGTPWMIARGLVFKSESQNKPYVVAGRVRLLQ